MANGADTGDAQLIRAARAGDEQAYAELYRRHRSSALRFARSLTGDPVDAEDLVAEAFARVLAALRSGNGPEEAFRPYLLAAVRNAFYDAARRSSREQPVDELTAAGVPFIDTAAAADEHRLVARAFRDLPERWQLVLWHTEVEGEQPADIAPLLGISANAVAALAYRAREGLRESYLRAHIGTAVDEGCRPTVSRLPAYTRNRLSRADAARVRRHLDDCDRCRLLFGELADVNSRLGALLGPVVLGGAAAAYVATRAAADGVVVGNAIGAGSLLRRIVARPEAKIGAGIGAAAGAIVLLLAFVAPSTSAPPESSAPALPAASTVPVVEPSSTGASDGPVWTVESPSGVTATLQPDGPLTPGQPGRLVLTVSVVASIQILGFGPLTVTVTLPTGITMLGSDGGEGWTCAGAGTVTCVLARLAVGEVAQTTLNVSVGPAVAGGGPVLQISGPGVDSSTGPVTVGGSGGVTVMTGPASIVAAGNSLLSCSLLALACTAARGGASVGGIDNDDYALEPYSELLAPLGAPLGSAVSSATLSLGGEVRWAGLYWAGTGAPPSSPTAYVRTPNGGGYQAVGATRVTQVSAPWLNRPVYQAAADVTELVRPVRTSGRWWVAVPAAAFASGTGAFAGWALVVIVDDGGPARTVAVVDGLVAVSGPDPVSIPLSGLVGGPATIGLVAWDGDRGRTGDTVTLDGVPLDASAPDNGLSSRTAGTPAGWNTFGTDARVFSGLARGHNPVVTAGAGTDEWLLGALVLATGP